MNPALAPPPHPSPASGRGSLLISHRRHLGQRWHPAADVLESTSQFGMVHPLSRLRGRVGEGAMVDEPGRPVWKTTSAARESARRLRRTLTDAERVMWNELRAHRLNDASFRRQKPIGPYIVDFACDAARLVIEIDGGQHYEAKGVENDARRDLYLKSEGYNILRFSNHDVLTNKAGVLETIISALQAKAPSLPSPASGGGEEIEGGDSK